MGLTAERKRALDLEREIEGKEICKSVIRKYIPFRCLMNHIDSLNLSILENELELQSNANARRVFELKTEIKHFKEQIIASQEMLKEPEYTCYRYYPCTTEYIEWVKNQLQLLRNQLR